MHSIHSLAHRAPPATRSRVRWQPYNALASASASTSASSSTSILSRSPSLSTPATSVSPPSPPKPTPLCEVERPQAHPSMPPQTPRDPSNPVRETKHKYASGLVDQAVKSLCEIWRPQDVPVVFLTASRANVGSCSEIPATPTPTSRRRNTQMSSPVSPPSLLVSAAMPCSRAAQAALHGDSDLASSNRTNLVPIKGFVHEVLRRSRTSGSVLQTALCYLEAIRPKVPELVRKEQSGEGTQTRYDSESRITPATPAELAREAELSAFNLDVLPDVPTEVMDTVRVSFDDVVCTATPSTGEEDQTLSGSQNSSTSQSASLALPSPLLCPRRAFLASLILASKFTQDKCYSNRAWAKLSGLPAREIGRCERALGDALDWRLWVGKSPAASSASPSLGSVDPAPVPNTKPVARCRSEGTFPLGNNSPFLQRKDKKDCTPATSPVARPGHRPLRRSSTLPADAFVERERSLPATSGSAARFDAAWARDGHQLSFSNIAQQDQLMGSPELNQARSPSTPSSSYSSQPFSSPIPPTPGLSYSPSSTESSSGDRTIQMSTFMDDNMAHDGIAVVGCGGEMAWGSTSGSPTLSGLAFEAALSSSAAVAGTAWKVPGIGKFVPDGTTAWRWDPAEYANAVALGPGSGVHAKHAALPSVPLGYLATERTPVYAERDSPADYHGSRGIP